MKANECTQEYKAAANKVAAQIIRSPAFAGVMSSSLPKIGDVTETVLLEFADLRSKHEDLCRAYDLAVEEIVRNRTLLNTLRSSLA